MVGEVISTVDEVTPSRAREFRRFRKMFLGRKVVFFGLVIILFFTLVALFAPIIAPYDPYAIDPSSVLSQPTAKHWLGTDTIGRDTLSRIMYGARTSLEIGLIAVIVGCIIGMTLGTIAGYFGGWTHSIVMRIIDALMSFPSILLALVIASLLGSGIKNVIIALSLTMIPAFARLMCGQVLSVTENEYILAERSIGAGHFRIMIRHIIPNCLSPIIIMSTMMLGGVILAEAGLSFLGVGITQPTAAWGSMVNEGRQYMLKLPILSFAPGIALMLLVFAFNMVGDGLRDALDPRLRGRI